MHVLAYDDADRLYLSVPVVGLAALLALGLGAAGATVYSSRVDDGADPATPSVAAPASADSGRCLLLKPLADTAVAEAVEVQKALQSQTEGMTDLRAHRLTGDDAVLRLSPALSAGSQHSVRLDVAVQQYRAAAAGCGG